MVGVGACGGGRDEAEVCVFIYFNNLAPFFIYKNNTTIIFAATFAYEIDPRY